MTDPKNTLSSVDREIPALLRTVTHTQDAVTRAKLRIALANRYREVGQIELSFQALEQAFEDAPEEPSVLRSVGLMKIRQGALKEGLALYDQGRWSLAEFQSINRPYPFPTWQGEPLAGKKILVWAEQGIGDQFMQARVLKPLLDMSAEITVEADPRVFPALKTMAPGVTWVTQSVRLVPELVAGPFDYQTSMLSAWRFVEGLDDHARCATADLHRKRAYSKAWRNIPGPSKLNVGLSWRSNAKARGAGRSLDLVQLSPLADMPHMRFHSIQYDAGDAVENAKAFGGPLFADSGLDTRNDLVGLFAMISALDLVITIDNATAHFAGVLGVTCWVITPKNADWRWGIDGSETHLYPSLRLFRSSQAGSFAGALHALYAAAASATQETLR